MYRLATMLLAALMSVSTVHAQSPSYVGQVQPFLDRYCSGCHTGWTAGGLFFTQNPASLKAGGKSGPGVVAGDLEKSHTIQRLQPKAGVKPMPPVDARQPLPEEIEMFRAWVANGARDDTGSARTRIPSVTPTASVKPIVTALAYSPDGKWLFAGSGATVARLDTLTGQVKDRIEGLLGKVTALALRPDGKQIVVASGQAGSLGELSFFAVDGAGMPGAKPIRRVTAHLDRIHQVTYSPDGKLLATGAYDRLVRLWDADTGKRLDDLRDHSDSVYGVSFSHDGKYLATAGADRAIKVWDVAGRRRLYTLSEATDWVYALAWHPTRPTLAGAGVDRNIRVWEITPTEGKLTAAAFAHEGAVLRLAFGPKGQTLYSLGEDRVAKAWEANRLVEKRVYGPHPETLHALAVQPEGKQIGLGRHDGVVVLLEAETGKPQGSVSTSAVTPEENAGGSPQTAQAIQLTATIEGKIFPAGDIDCYRFEATAGQEVGVQVTLPMGSKLEAALELLDPKGQSVASSSTGLLAHVCTQAGTYTLAVRDREYRGEAGFTYTLKVGAVPVVTSVFPLGVQRGTETEVQLQGANLGDARVARIKVPADAVIGSKVNVPAMTPLGAALGNPVVVVGEFPEKVRAGATLPVPGTGNGRIEKPLQVDRWKFTAKKGQRLVVETLARRVGSPLDSMLEIVDARGQPVPTVTLRCVAKVYTTFRDNDSVTNGMRLESWNELSVNDYVLVGTEVARILTLPRNPDDDCRFFTEAGQRLGYFGTTPTHHPLGEAVYKLSVNPPGTTFPPNGLPVVTLVARNDDGGPGYGKDSRLFFDPPADGEYEVRVSDSRDLAGIDFSYRVTVREPRPDFRVKVTPAMPTVSRGGAIPVEVTAERLDGFAGPIAVELRGLPAGLSAPRSSILAGENTTAVSLLAEAEAKLPAGAGPTFTVVARAQIGEQAVERTVISGKLSVIDPGDIVTRTAQSEVSIVPGGQTRITVTVERRNGFTGRIPIEVRGLPHGVRVLDVGLNGILVTPTETRRTFLLYAEPWVEATDHPIVVLAKRESKTPTEHAAPSVLLRVQGKQP